MFSLLLLSGAALVRQELQPYQAYSLDLHEGTEGPMPQWFGLLSLSTDPPI